MISTSIVLIFGRAEFIYYFTTSKRTSITLSKGINFSTAKKTFFTIILLTIGYLSFNTLSIYQFSKIYSEKKSDIAIVLGAGTSNGQLSPVFKERINHSIYLYNHQIVHKIIFTGGYGIDQTTSDSQVAKLYASDMGLPESDLIIEEKSRYTIENLMESKKIMDSLNLHTALLVSDPLHMKRAMKMANELGINCQSSPTKTSMYRSAKTRMNSLCYETFFFSIGLLTSNWM